jgi:GTPase SAR1 family protein
MSGTHQYGLIILGNSGVGKSFLANIFVGHDAFVQQFKATSVTHSTELVEVRIGSYTLTVFNIPGLIEAEQERIDLNKKEIDKAFSQRPNSIIMFVFGQRNGRIREQDIVAFHAINAAYPFRPESLVLVINGVSKSRPSDYEETTLVLLQKLLKGVNVNNNNLCFTDLINVNDSHAKQALKNRLVPVS